MNTNSFKIKKSTFVLVIFFSVTFFLYAVGFDFSANMMFISSLIVLLWESSKNPELLAIALIIMETRLFGAGPAKIFGILPEKLEIIILFVSYFLWLIKKKCNQKMIPQSYKWMNYTVIIIVVAAVMGYITVGQSIIFGIFLQTRLLVIFSVFPIIALMKNKKNSFQQLWRWVKIMALAQSIINSVQLLLYSKIQFLTITSENIRFGSIRITYGYVLVAVAFMMAFSEFLDNLDMKNGIYCLIYLMEILFVCKTRMVIFGIGIAVIIASIGKLKYKSGWKKVLVLALWGVLMIMVMSSRITDLINLTKKEITTNSGNYMARTQEIVFYTEQVKHPIVGRGYISPKSEGGAVFDTKYGYYSLTDIGIIGLYTTNGVLGIIWFGVIVLVVMKNSRNSIRKVYYIEYIVYSIAVCMTLLNFYYSSEYLVITLVLLADNSRGLELSQR